MTHDEKRFAVRSAVVAAVLFVLFAFFTDTWRFFEKKFYVATGEAEWIWVTEPMRKEAPVAAFFVREFTVPPDAQFVKINVAADPGYTLDFNGVIVGRGAFALDRAVDSYDVTPLRRAGANRLLIAVRSEKGAGGLLASVDFGPMARSVIFSNEQWKRFNSWSDALPLRDEGRVLPVRSFGPPPIGRWNFPHKIARELLPAQENFESPTSVEEFDGVVPETRILSGVAVASLRRERARAFDFGTTRGCAVLRRRGGEPAVVLVRFANGADEFSGQGEMHAMVFGEGEREIVDPIPRDFRYLLVYGSDADALVIRR